MMKINRRDLLTVATIVPFAGAIKPVDGKIENSNNLPVIKFSEDKESIINMEELLKHKVEMDTLEKYNEYLKLRGYDTIAEDIWKTKEKGLCYIRAFSNDVIYGIYYGEVVVNRMFMFNNCVVIADTINSIRVRQVPGVIGVSEEIYDKLKS